MRKWMSVLVVGACLLLPLAGCNRGEVELPQTQPAGPGPDGGSPNSTYVD